MMRRVLALALAPLAATLALPSSSSGGPRLSLTSLTRSPIAVGNSTTSLVPRFAPVQSLATNFPDPSIIWGAGGWWAYATGEDGPFVQAAYAPDFAGTWTYRGEAMPRLAPWVDANSPQIWAPDVNQHNGNFFLYYSAKVAGANAHCVGVATSTSGPAGPFVDDAAQPLVCPLAQGGAIDPSGYDDGGSRYLVYKVDGNSLRPGLSTCGGDGQGAYRSTPIMLQRMSDDGLSLVGAPTQILDNLGAANDGIVEAPSLFHIPGGAYVLFYSAHCFTSDDYDVEYAFSSSIDGQFGDRRVLLSRPGGDMFGPGGLDIDPNGRMVSFHARTQAGGGGPRALFTAEITVGGGQAHF